MIIIYSIPTSISLTSNDVTLVTIGTMLPKKKKNLNLISIDVNDQEIITQLDLKSYFFKKILI